VNSSLPQGWRPLQVEDAPAVAELLVEDETAHGLPGKLSAADILTWWRRTDLDRNSWAREEDGRLVAVGWIEQYGGDVHGGGAVRPGEKGRGFGVALVEMAERRARELEGPFVRQFALGADEVAKALFESRGYKDVRHHYVMALRLDSEPSPPMLPEGFAIDSFRDGDAAAFHATAGEAFAEEWGHHALPFDEWWEMRKDDDQSLWFVIRDGGEIAACERCDVMHGGGFVGMLGVRKPWRRRGFGRALLLHAFREFRRRGFERASLGVDSENPTGATRLYESVGMHVESEHVTFEKDLA
jgi:mycothiol synthase